MLWFRVSNFFLFPFYFVALFLCISCHFTLPVLFPSTVIEFPALISFTCALFLLVHIARCVPLFVSQLTEHHTECYFPPTACVFASGFWKLTGYSLWILRLLDLFGCFWLWNLSLCCLINMWVWAFVHKLLNLLCLLGGSKPLFLVVCITGVTQIMLQTPKYNYYKTSLSCTGSYGLLYHLCYLQHVHLVVTVQNLIGLDCALVAVHFSTSWGCFYVVFFVVVFLNHCFVYLYVFS